MTRRRNNLFVASVLAFAVPAVGCGSEFQGGGPDAGETRPEPQPDPDDDSCSPVESHLMIVLDRTGSMAQRPDGTMPPNTAAGIAETKWYAAVTTIKDVVSAYEDKIGFGLTLFPRDPNGAGGQDCSNLGTWLKQYLPPETNDASCQPAEVEVSTTDSSFDDIDAAIDVTGTGLCSTTPIGSGLQAAKDALADEMASAGTSKPAQAVLLITDGVDNCDDEVSAARNSLLNADALFAKGVQTHVVGFDGSGDGIDPKHLNDLACAGGTAPNPGRNCTATATGGYRAVVAPSPGELFYLAGDQGSLMGVLMKVADDVACIPNDDGGGDDSGDDDGSGDDVG